MARVLVVLPTNSYRTTDFVAAARSLGVELAVASEEEPPIDLGDRFVKIDCTDPDAAATAIVDLADHTPIDAVVAADDAGVVVAALASERLGLVSHSSEAAKATRDKLIMRRLFASSEILQPRFAALTDDGGGAVDALGFPLVLKPRTGAASRGVIRVNTQQELDAALPRLRQIAEDLGETGPLLAEEFIPGAEVALEGIVANGHLVVLAIFDKPDAPSGPTFPETLLVTPSRHSPEALEDLERMTTTAVSRLGLAHGPVHAEARITPEGRVYLLEIAARSIGGLCSRTLRFGLDGASLEEVILATALGRSAPGHRQPRATGVMMLPVTADGILRSVEGVDEALAIEEVSDVDISIPPGTAIRPLPEGDRYLGFIFANGRDPEHVADSLRAAARRIEVSVDSAPE